MTASVSYWRAGRVSRRVRLLAASTGRRWAIGILHAPALVGSAAHAIALVGAKIGIAMVMVGIAPFIKAGLGLRLGR